MTTTSEPQAATEAPPKRGLSGKLGVGAIVLMVVAAASPLTVIGGSVPLGILLGNGIGFPALFVGAAVVLLLFSVGLAAMTKQIPKPGGFFTFVVHGLGKPSGLATAYVALLAYTTVQVAVYGYFGYVLSVTISGLGGPEIAWWIYALVGAALVGLLGYRHIDLSSKVLGVLLLGEIVHPQTCPNSRMPRRRPRSRTSPRPKSRQSVTSSPRVTCSQTPRDSPT